MGVSGGFYNALRPVLVHTKLRALPRVGGRLVAALDVSIWLHKLGGSVNPLGVVVDKDYTETAEAIIGRLRRLHGHGVEVLVVFDGASSPAKMAEDSSRAAARKEAEAALEALLAKQAAGEAVAGTDLRDAARKAFRRTPEFTAAVQAALDVAGFRWTVAPEEADAHLAWLAITGRVQYVLSEDADLVVLGCPRVLRNLDVFEGTATLVEHERVIGTLTANKSDLVSVLHGRGREGLWLLACLAGNDYSKFRDVSLGLARQILGEMPPGSASPADAVAAAKSLNITLPINATTILEAAISGEVLPVVACTGSQYE